MEATLFAAPVIWKGAKVILTAAQTVYCWTLNAHWVQAMCAFQMLSVDLLAVTVLLFAIALGDLGPVERPILIGLIVLYASWGLVWMVQVKWLNRPQMGLFRLPHWVVWFACAVVLFWGL